MGGHVGQWRLPDWDLDDGMGFVLLHIGRLVLLCLAGLAVTWLTDLLAAHPAAAQTAAPASNIFAPLAQPIGQTIDFMAWGGRLFGFLMLLFAGGRTAMKGQVDWPTILSASFGILLFLIAAPLSAWLAAMATSEPVTEGGGGGSGQLPTWKCLLCEPVTVRLEASLRTFRDLAFKGLAAPAYGLARIGVVIFTFIWAWKLLGNPDEARNAIPRFVQQFLWSCLAFGLLSSPDWVVVTLLGGFEKAFLNTAAYMLQLAQAHFASGLGLDLATDYDNSAYVYSKLWAQVEATVVPLIGVFFARLESVLDIGKAILAIILAVPFVFVAGIFIAFLAQTLFYVAAICAVSPLLIAGMMFGPIRSMLFASLRFAMGGGLTLIVAAIAMGVTGTLTVDLITTAGNEALAVQQAEQRRNDEFVEGLPIPSATEMISDFFAYAVRSFEADADPEDVTSNSFLSSEAAAAMLNPRRISFYLALGAGAVSVILHLAAPRIASNIMGVTDSATSAGIVVAATQAAMTMVVGKAGQTAFGQHAPFHKPWWAGRGGGGDDAPSGSSGGSSFMDQFRAAAGTGLRGAGERLGGGGS